MMMRIGELFQPSIQAGRAIIRAFVAALCLASATSAQAASTDFEFLDPTPAPEGSLMTEDPEAIPGFFAAGGYMQFEKDPVVFARQGEYADQFVRYRWQLRAVGTLKLLPFWQASVDLPMTMLSDLNINNLGAKFYMNDLILRTRLKLGTLERSYGNVHFGVAASLIFPTGDAANLAGVDDRFSEPTIKALIELDRPKWFLRTNLGYKERQRTLLSDFNITLDDQILYRFGWGWRGRGALTPTYFVDFAGSTKLFDGDFFSTAQHNANELFGGVELKKRRMTYTPGVGIGMSRAYGIPTWRLVLGVFFMPGAPPVQAPGDLNVTLIDNASEPVSGAAMTLTTKNVLTYEAKTNLEGIAEFSNIPSGKATLRAEKVGYYPALSTTEVLPAQTNNVWLVIERIAKIGDLAVLLKDQAGLPVSGAVAYVKTPRHEFKAAADENGEAFLQGLPPGEVTVTTKLQIVGARTFAPASAAAYVHNQQRSSLTLTLVEQLPAPPQVSASVLDAEKGTPIDYGVITVEEFKRKLRYQETFSEGQWRKEFKEPGAYRLRFDAEGYFPARVSLTTGWNDQKQIIVNMAPKGETKVLVTATDIYIADKIFFRTASAVILAKSFPILDALAKVLEEHPEVTLMRISGHTDSSGSRTYNTRLSHDRARSVFNYLVGKGINPRRLEYQGYGPDRPIDTNKTEDGKANNRRVEFEVLEQNGQRVDAEDSESLPTAATTPTPAAAPVNQDAAGELSTVTDAPAPTEATPPPTAAPSASDNSDAAADPTAASDLAPPADSAPVAPVEPDESIFGQEEP